ncbi:hypothetical protein B5S28_g2725 [[Candida] boidinii]|nr:hypothetical protein B5S28_g2725 [[Candida] boidinii]OWB61675.1 hypothetical protein B5S29_g2575 [[Candida] boidinii]OWB72416.1 hypothetical protein B5S31_g2125 [[Candida] boidinii]OWB78308.1 hypothetical protein B5S32_g2499 [[Candida] boidinii]
MSSDMLNSTGIEIVSGLTAGFTTTLITHPLDFLKLNLQLDKFSKNNYIALLKIKSDLIRASSSSTTSNSLSISKKKLIYNIYRGISPNLIGSTTAWGLYFMFYKEFKNLTHSTINNNYFNDKDKDSDEKFLNSGHYLICGFMAGCLTSILTNPIWVIKTRMITSRLNDKNLPKNYYYNSIIDGFYKIYKNEGLKGYYKGLSPALLNVSQGALQFAIYDTLKSYINNTSNGERLTTFQYLYSSAISKMVSTIVFYPLQILRSRLQAIPYDNTHNTKNNERTMISISKDLIKNEGLKGFYKGIDANLIRVLPATCITFIVYENMKLLLTSI